MRPQLSFRVKINVGRVQSARLMMMRQPQSVTRGGRLACGHLDVWTDNWKACGSDMRVADPAMVRMLRSGRPSEASRHKIEAQTWPVGPTIEYSRSTISELSSDPMLTVFRKRLPSPVVLFSSSLRREAASRNTRPANSNGLMHRFRSRTIDPFQLQTKFGKGPPPCACTSLS
jgi:hypothetical protein